MKCEANPERIDAYDSGHSSRRTLWTTLFASFLLVALLQLLSACAAEPREAPDPYAPYRAALKPAFQSDFDRLQGAPHYALNVTLDPTGDFLTGNGEILVTNYTGDPWRNLVFRLYPALAHYGGQMTIRSVLIDGQAATFDYLAENTAVRIDLPATLTSGQIARVQLTWRLEIPRWADSPTVYALYGRSGSMTSLPLFYPSLAVYQPGPTLGMGAWWLDMGTPRGDAAFNVASLFVVTATLPVAEVPVASGTLISSTPLTTEAGDEMTRHVWAAGPVREFLIHTSPQFASDTVETYGTRVTSYWLPGNEAAGRNALRYAVTALRIYSDYFGEYPFTDMHVAPAPLAYRGMEYPQVNLIGVDLYTRVQNSMEILVAHEVAHQWWYQIVHNDPVNTPWLDEALAEYAVKLYFEGLRGDAVAQQLQRQRWLTPVTLLLQGDNAGNDTGSAAAAIDRPVANFASGIQYETVIYGRGALLYDTKRAILGERPFRRFLRDYLDRYRYRIVTTADWLRMVEELGNAELFALYDEWVASPESHVYAGEQGSSGPIAPTTGPVSDPPVLDADEGLFEESAPPGAENAEEAETAEDAP